MEAANDDAIAALQEDGQPPALWREVQGG
jgi:hypothetical protein